MAVHQQNVKQCVSENQTLKPEKVLEQDITVAIQDQRQRPDIGLAESGNHYI